MPCKPGYLLEKGFCSKILHALFIYQGQACSLSLICSKKGRYMTELVEKPTHPVPENSKRRG